MPRPTGLFGSGEKGCLIDFGDTATLWQVAVGNTPATANNDPVAAASDQSGNNKHLDSGSNNPTLKISGGRTWVEGDGVNDAKLGYPLSQLINASQFEIVLGFRVDSIPTSGGLVYQAPALILDTNNHIYLCLRDDGGGELNALVYTSSAYVGVATAYTPATDAVVFMRLVGGQLGISTDGTTWTETACGNPDSLTGAIQAFPGTYQPAVIKEYGFVVRDTVFTTQERADIKEWLVPSTEITPANLSLTGQEITLTQAGSSQSWAAGIYVPVTQVDQTFTKIGLRRRSVATDNNVTVAVTAANLTLAGQSVTLIAGESLTLAVDAANLTLAGQSVPLDSGLPVVPANLSLAGQSIALAVGMPIAPENLTLTGQNITLLTGGELVVAVEPADLPLVGQAIGMSTTMVVTPSGLIFTPQSIDFFRSLVAGTANLTLTGQTIDFIGGEPVVVAPPPAIPYGGGGGGYIGSYRPDERKQVREKQIEIDQKRDELALQDDQDILDILVMMQGVLHE